MGTPAVERTAPPGWYPDPVEQPARHHRQRYWDGHIWTPRVADGDRVSLDPMPAPSPDTRTALPGRAGWYAVAGLVVGQVLATAGYLLGVRLPGQSVLVPLVLSQLGLWTGLIGACVLASRRWGTGSVLADYAIRTTFGDVGRGLLLALTARAAAGVVVTVLAVLAPELAGTNSGVFGGVQQDRAALIAFALMLVIGAPLVEETFFRGLLQRSLRCRLGIPTAVGLQGLAFGAVHVVPTQGWGNVGLIAALALAGLVLGAAAEHYRRLGPSMWAHAWFNLLPATVLIATA
jgi:membrane protease YdiL (CAAX protease family)